VKHEESVKSSKEELQRVIPVIRGISSKHSIPISIDTTKAIVAEEALRAGANIINDISALQKDPEMISVVQQTNVPVIIMHMQINPEYRNVIVEILDFFKKQIDWIKEKPDKLFLEQQSGQLPDR